MWLWYNHKGLENHSTCCWPVVNIAIFFGYKWKKVKVCNLINNKLNKFLTKSFPQLVDVSQFPSFLSFFSRTCTTTMRVHTLNFMHPFWNILQTVCIQRKIFVYTSHFNRFGYHAVMIDGKICQPHCMDIWLIKTHQFHPTPYFIFKK